MKAQDLIKRHEGLSLTVYICPAGARTIGYGHNIDSRGLPAVFREYLETHGQITDEIAELLLKLDIKDAYDDCAKLYPRLCTFSEARQAALIDFLFNLGLNRAFGFKRANAAINQGNWQAAADEMKDSTWYRQVKSRGETIVKMIREG
ncbi:MAG: glycoside hydrolase family protein [Desulfobacterales bacterium]|nr:glycoside hydrolase family protein [Desulfobacterales bacterium]